MDRKAAGGKAFTRGAGAVRSETVSTNTLAARPEGSSQQACAYAALFDSSIRRFVVSQNAPAWWGEPQTGNVEVPGKGRGTGGRSTGMSLAVAAAVETAGEAGKVEKGLGGKPLRCGDGGRRGVAVSVEVAIGGEMVDAAAEREKSEVGFEAALEAGE